MRLRNVRRSKNVVDRRGRGRSAAGLSGLGLIAVLAVGLIFGVDVTPLLTGSGGAPFSQSDAPRSAELSAEEQQAGDFAARVLATTEDVWADLYPQATGQPYDPPRLILFSGTTTSACGGATAATGPFYCPRDESAYLDTEFFATMARELGAGGDFAAAYVIAHEVAHHVQNELGILPQVQQAQARSPGREANELSVRLELMADCMSGLWASRVRDLMEPGDIEEALNAARRIGDDYIAKRLGRAVNPHAFTHGSSEQRASWFARGYNSGTLNACDTFNTDRL